MVEAISTDDENIVVLDLSSGSSGDESLSQLSDESDDSDFWGFLPEDLHQY